MNATTEPRDVTMGISSGMLSIQWFQTTEEEQTYE
jgi:hypothetical protein